MRNITRNSVTRQHRERHQVYLHQFRPDDDQQLEYLRIQFPNRSVVQILQIFQILNNREHPRLFQIIQFNTQIQNSQNNILRSVAERTMANQAAQNLVFVDDPYQGDINPGTTDGAKLYLKATASISDDEKFDLTISSAQKFFDLMRRDSK